MRRITQIALFALLTVCHVFAAEWTRVGDLPVAEFLSVSVSGNTLYAGGPGTLYSKTDCNAEWGSSSPINENADNVAASIVIGDRIFVGVWNEGVFESTDNGATWTPRNYGLGSGGGRFPMDFAVRGDSLYVATDGEAVFVMDLHGPAVWSTYRNGLDFGVQWNVRCLENIDGVLVAGAGANGTVSTREGTQTEWKTNEFSQFDGQVLSMLDLQTSGGKVYGVSNDGLYVSSDSGRTWEQTLAGIGLISNGGVCSDDSRIFAMACKPGLFTRIYQRIQGNWVTVEDIPQTSSYSIAVYCNRLYLARADGLWYRELDQTDIPDDNPVLPNPASLEQNFPNPFNPTTSIRFVVNQPSIVKITVFNILGQEVEVLLDEFRSIGAHSVEWNGINSDSKSMPAGVYFYRLQIGSYSETRKMVLLK